MKYVKSWPFSKEADAGLPVTLEYFPTTRKVARWGLAGGQDQNQDNVPSFMDDMRSRDAIRRSSATNMFEDFIGCITAHVKSLVKPESFGGKKLTHALYVLKSRPADRTALQKPKANPSIEMRSALSDGDELLAWRRLRSEALLISQSGALPYKVNPEVQLF